MCVCVGAGRHCRKKSKEEAEKLRKAHEETLQAKEELAERLRREEEERERARQVRHDSLSMLPGVL